MQQQNVNYATNYAPFAALFWLVIVVTLGVRSVGGAIVAAACFSLFEMVFLKGAFLGWILRGTNRIPGLFPIDGKWVLVLFGLSTIQFARRPAGLLHSFPRRSDRWSWGSPEDTAPVAGPPVGAPLGRGGYRDPALDPLQELVPAAQREGRA